MKMFKPPLTFLGVTKYGHPILTVETFGQPDAGVRIWQRLTSLVPPYEEHSARLAAGYTLPQWKKLDYWERVLEVAIQRVNNKVEELYAEKNRRDMRVK